ncbi:MAG: hypothetical protein KGL39_32615 [Patescibacteria group bacterium]|nr:hypothetical protein [Patescibacteria group bacterium]
MEPLTVEDLGRIAVDEERVQGVPRKKDRRFVAELVSRMASNGGVITESDLVAAAQATWTPSGNPANRKKETIRAEMLAKAESKLKLSEIGEAIANFFQASVGFSLADAADLMVQHIKGIEYEKTYVSPVGDTRVIVVKEKPSYQALKDFMALVTPREPKQINVDQRTLVARMNVQGSYEQPSIDAIPIDTKGPSA